MKLKLFVMIFALGATLFLSSCGGTAAAVATYTIGGTVFGLSGTGLVLQDNGGDNLTIGASGSFTFATTVVSSGNYAVTVLSQPANPAQTCAVTNGSGMASAAVSDVQIVCTTNSFTVGVTVTGLSGAGLVLQNNGTNNLPVAANGGYTFSMTISRGSTYNVTVLTQPSGPAQTCGVTNGFGTVTIANATGIQVNCFTTSTAYTIGVAVTGLSGTGLVLQDNGGDNLPVSANGSFTFAAPIPSGATYSVTALMQPSNPAQNCVVSIGNGTASANVTGMPVLCSNTMANISVTVSGLLPHTSVVLQDNGGDDLTVSTNGANTNFNSPVAKGASYEVSVRKQPLGSTCIAGTNAIGTAPSTNIGVTVTCGAIIAAGESHTCAIAEAGSVWCWGANAHGQLGNGTLTHSSTPVEVLNAAGDAPLGRVVQISAGQDHTCAVTSGGAALCWGDNSDGELGNGSTTESTLPVQVAGLTIGMVEIAAGTSHACALTDGGVAWCWGLNSSGQLGDGTLNPSSTPVQVLDSTRDAPLSGAVAISAGQDGSCALTQAGTTTCWGDTADGQLGTSDSTSAGMSEGGSGSSNAVVEIAVGASHSCAILTTGTVLCWGLNTDGQLGNDSVVSSSEPVEVVGMGDAGVLQLF